MALAPREPKHAAGKKPRDQSVLKYLPDRYRLFAEGELTVDDLDEEEIMRGQFRNRNGDFRGGVPKIIPREFMVQVMERQKQIVQGEIAGLVTEATKTLQEVMQKRNPQPGDNARVNAAKLILERYLGRVPENINLRAEVNTFDKNTEDLIIIEHIGEREDGQDQAGA